MNASLASHRSPMPSSPRPPRAKRSWLIFAAIAACFFTVDGLIARSTHFLARPELLTGAITFNLTLGVTIAYWLIVVRRGDAPARTLIPVFVFAVGGATLTLPPGHRELVHYARLLAVPFEVAVIAAIGIAVRSAQRRLTAVGTELDVPERIGYVFHASGLTQRIAEIISTESAILYYALASWRQRPFVPRAEVGFSYHKRNGGAGVIYALAAVSAIEIAIVDLVVRLHAPRAANVLIALGVVSTIWLFGVARAIQLRPHVVTRDRVALRYGLRYSVDVPLTNIASVDTNAGARRFTATRDALRFGRGNPNVVLRFVAPIEVRGGYGFRRLVTSVGLTVDDPATFARAVQLQDAH